LNGSSDQSGDGTPNDIGQDDTYDGKRIRNRTLQLTFQNRGCFSGLEICSFIEFISSGVHFIDGDKTLFVITFARIPFNSFTFFRIESARDLQLSSG